MSIIYNKPAWIYWIEVDQCYQILTEIYWYAIKFDIDVLDCDNFDNFKKQLKLKKKFNFIKEEIKYPSNIPYDFHIEEDEFDKDYCRELYFNIHPNDKKYIFYYILDIYTKNLKENYNIAWLFDNY